MMKINNIKIKDLLNEKVKIKRIKKIEPFVNMNMLNIFVNEFKLKYPEGTSKYLNADSILIFFNIEKKSNTLPLFLIEAIESENILVEKVRGNPVYRFEFIK